MLPWHQKHRKESAPRNLTLGNCQDESRGFCATAFESTLCARRSFIVHKLNSIL